MGSTGRCGFCGDPFRACVDEYFSRRILQNESRDKEGQQEISKDAGSGFGGRLRYGKFGGG